MACWVGHSQRDDRPRCQRFNFPGVGRPVHCYPTPGKSLPKTGVTGDDIERQIDLGREQPPNEIDEAVAYLGETVWFRAGGLGRIITILAVPGSDLYSIGQNDSAQSLGYSGQPDHAEVVRTMQEVTHRIKQAGRMMQLDVMEGAWVSDMLLDAGRHIFLP